MRTIRQASWIAWLVGVALILVASPAVAEPGQSKLVKVEATVASDSVRIEAKATAPFDFTTYRPSERLFVVDLAGVTPAVAGGARVLKSDLVSSYRVLPYRGGDRSIVRLEILLRVPAEPRVDRIGTDGLAITFQGVASAKATPKPELTAPARAAASVDSAATAIERVDVVRNGENARVEIGGNGRLTCEVMRLTNPNRVVIDFSGVRARTTQKAINSEILPVKSVRVGQFRPDVARIVIDLDKNEPHSVRANGNLITIDFAGAKPVAAAPKQLPSDTPKSTESATTPVAPAPAPVQAAEVQSPPAPSQSELKSEKMPLPENLTQTAGALATPTSAAPKDEPKSQPVTPAVVPPAVTSAPSNVRVEAQASQAGEPISVNLKDVDLKDFFRLIHEISGLNVVVDPNVRGTVTLVLDDVPWNQALDIVLRNNSLDKQIEGNVLRIATRETVRKEAEARRDLVKVQAESVDQVTTTRTLSYAKAANVRDTLKRFLSSRGEVLADERSNTLIIRDIPSVLPEIDNLLKQIDRRSQQVEIEARVVAATRAFTREIGTQFGFATSSTGGRTVYGGLVGNGDFISPIVRGTGLPTPPLVASGTSSIPLNTALGAVAPTSGASFAHSSPNFALDFIISAAESRGVGKLLSKPKVITQNNVKATVKQGTKIPVQTVINNTISVQFVDAVLKLEVTPQISAEGTVYVDIVVENTAIETGIPRVNGIPALTTQYAETSALVNDGGTVVIGGVTISQQNTDIAQVPLFGSIPLIGHLFKRTTVRTQSQELLFFITPRIVPT